MVASVSGVADWLGWVWAAMIARVWLWAAGLGVPAGGTCERPSGPVGKGGRRPSGSAGGPSKRPVGPGRGRSSDGICSVQDRVSQKHMIFLDYAVVGPNIGRLCSPWSGVAGQVPAERHSGSDDQGQGQRQRVGPADDSAVQEDVREGRSRQGHQAQQLLREAFRTPPSPDPQEHQAHYHRQLTDAFLPLMPPRAVRRAGLTQRRMRLASASWAPRYLRAAKGLAPRGRSSPLGQGVSR